MGANRVVYFSSFYKFCEFLFHHVSLYVSGMVAALTNESATSKSVYFAHCTSEMIFITHLLTEQPEKLAGPLLADTYVTLLKGRNAWYGQMLAKGELSPDMGDSIKGKGMIQVIQEQCFFNFIMRISLTKFERRKLQEMSKHPGCWTTLTFAIVPFSF